MECNGDRFYKNHVMLHMHSSYGIFLFQGIFERLFRDIDEYVTFQYFKSFRRVRVNFTNHEQATEARDKFHMTEFRDEIIKCYFTQVRVS